MKTMILVILTAAITNNYVLVKFLGICPFLGVSKKLDQATGMSLAVIFVEVLATAVTWPIYHFLLAGKVDFTYMETVVFILVIAALVQLVEIVLKRYVPALHKSLGVYPAAHYDELRRAGRDDECHFRRHELRRGASDRAWLRPWLLPRDGAVLRRPVARGRGGAAQEL